MEKERIEIIYQILINDLDLTTESLINYGIKDEEIEFFIAKRIIEPINYRTFKLVSVEKLRQYGVKLLLNLQSRKANICFKKCYELAPTGRNIALQYFLSKIVTKNYKEAFEIFNNLEKQKPEKYEKDNNLYLYLLSMVSDYIPQEYQERIKNIKLEDIILPYLTCNKVENDIRIALAQHKFKYAYQLINSRNEKEADYSVKFETIRVLTTQAIGIDRRIKSNLLYQVKHEQYHEIISTLKNIKEQRQLSKIESSVLKLSEEIVNIMENKTIPTLKDTHTGDIYEAIENNNFKLAQELNKQFLEYTNINNLDNIIYILLIKLNHLIEEQIKENESQNLGSVTEGTINNDIPETKNDDVQESNKEVQPSQEDELKEIEDLAYYISSQNISLYTAKKRLGIFPEQLLLIKLVYARDYYIESNYELGDKLLKEVELSFNVTPKVIKILQKIKQERDNYKKQYNPHKKTLTKD